MYFAMIVDLSDKCGEIERLKVEGQGIEADRVLRFKSSEDTVKIFEEDEDEEVESGFWSDCWATKAGGTSAFLFPQSPDSYIH
jgi:hypothetical protein